MPRQYSIAPAPAALPLVSMEQWRVSLPFAWYGNVDWLSVGFQIHRKRAKAIKRKTLLEEKKGANKLLWSQNILPPVVSSAPVAPITGHVLGCHQQWDTKGVPVTALSSGGELGLFQSCFSWERAWKWIIYVQGFKITLRGMRGTALLYFLRLLNHGFRCLELIMVLLAGKPRIGAL